VDDVIEVTEKIVPFSAKALPDQSNSIQQGDDVIEDTEKIVPANAKALPEQSNRIQQVLFQIFPTHIITFHIISIFQLVSFYNLHFSTGAEKILMD
jgi:hypothetical protein